VFLDRLPISEPVAAECEYAHPEGPAENVVDGELGVVHRAHAGHERGKRADDRDEAGDDDRHAAILLEESVGPIEIFLLQKAAEGLGPDEVCDSVIDRVARDGRRASGAGTATWG